MALDQEPAGTLTDRARQAQKRQRWAEAEALWRELLKVHPADRSARAALGAVLLSRRRFDQARAIAAALRKDFPNDVAAIALAARIAGEERDWAAAAALWREALAIRSDATAALAGLGGALFAAGDLKGAQEWGDHIAARFPNQVHGDLLLARVATARGQLERAVDITRALSARFPFDKVPRREFCRALLAAGHLDEAEAEANKLLATDREEGLMQLGNVLARRRPDDDYTDFWKAARRDCPDNVIFLRREAMAAMKAGRTDDAVVAMTALLTGPDASLYDAGLVAGLVQILLARGEMATMRRTVRDYLRGLRGSAAYRLGVLRFCRVIFAFFAAPDTRRRLSYHERTSRAVWRAPLKPKARQLLERSLALEAALATKAPVLLDTDVSRNECLSFIDLVRQRVARREPFSFVRMNDAESNAFPYEPHLAAHFAADAAEREHVWWGRAVSPAERAALSDRVAQAAWSADAIGIPTFARILRDVHLLENDDLSTLRTGRGLLAGLAAFERFEAFRPAGLPAPLFTSANLHQDLQRWTLYGQLFDGIGEIALVTCHPGLADAMKRTFGLAVSANVIIPPRHASIPFMSERPDTPHILPEVIDDIVAQVRAHAAGRMVVVGAGYLGKWIVHQAKAAGGIALDLGSALDYWIGLKSRSYQDLA